MINDAQVIAQTEKWIQEVVIGCNFCPFAARVIKQSSVRYRVAQNHQPAHCLEALMKEVALLDEEEKIETAFLIIPEGLEDFSAYLGLVSMAEYLLKENGYEGVYQLASFHPNYLFAGAPETDAANYTNRSVYPMLHLLRESSIDQALEFYKDPEDIPERNINFAREKGLTYMKMLRDACLQG